MTTTWNAETWSMDSLATVTLTQVGVTDVMPTLTLTNDGSDK